MSSMKNRVLITGASGLLGRAVKKAFSDQNQYWEVLGTAFCRANEDLIILDLTQESEVLKTVQNFKPHVIIHCAAERRPDVVEKQEAATYQLNVEATSTMCKAAAECHSWLLYISTDYVFDGNEPPYQVNAKPKPLNKYGLSKLQGEEIVKKASAEFAILRVPILYGQVEKIEESAVTILWKNIRNAVSCKMSDYERRYPTHTDDVGSVILAMAERKVKGENLGGIFHWSGDENMTKYDMAIAMASVFGLSTDHIIADKTASTGARPGAPRPGAPRPGAPRPGAPRPGAPRPGAPRPGARPGAPRPGAPRPGAPRPGAPRPGVPRPGAPRPGAHRPGAPRPGAPRPRAPRPGARPGPPGRPRPGPPGRPRPGAPRPGAPRPGAPRPGGPRPGAPRPGPPRRSTSTRSTDLDHLDHLDLTMPISVLTDLRLWESNRSGLHLNRESKLLFSHM